MPGPLPFATTGNPASMSDVLVENAGAVAIVTLNRPAQMNALSASVRAGLAEAFRALDADDTVKAVVLTGAGEKAFCAGLDLKELGAGDASPLAIIEGEDDPVATLLRCRKPIVGAINGVAITGGFELALACDVLIASTEARFADTHGLVGIMPGWGLSARLSRIVGISRAKAMSLTGTFIDANTAMVWGLVNRVTKPADLLPLALQIAGNMAVMPAETLIEYKRLDRRWLWAAVQGGARTGGQPQQRVQCEGDGGGYRGAAGRGAGQGAERGGAADAAAAGRLGRPCAGPIRPGRPLRHPYETRLVSRPGDVTAR